MKKQQFGVIGLGRFGTSLATELYNSSHDVLAVDLNEEVVKSISPSVNYAVQADGSDIAALKAIGISNMDVVIVALARDISASLLTALNACSFNNSPNRASDSSLFPYDFSHIFGSNSHFINHRLFALDLGNLHLFRIVN